MKTNNFEILESELNDGMRDIAKRYKLKKNEYKKQNLSLNQLTEFSNSIGNSYCFKRFCETHISIVLFAFVSS